jgi:hypothetical protein
LPQLAAAEEAGYDWRLLLPPGTKAPLYVRFQLNLGGFEEYQWDCSVDQGLKQLVVELKWDW